VNPARCFVLRAARRSGAPQGRCLVPCGLRRGRPFTHWGEGSAAGTSSGARWVPPGAGAGLGALPVLAGAAGRDHAGRSCQQVFRIELTD
jgi:hypothetical protein